VRYVEWTYVTSTPTELSTAVTSCLLRCHRPFIVPLQEKHWCSVYTTAVDMASENLGVCRFLKSENLKNRNFRFLRVFFEKKSKNPDFRLVVTEKFKKKLSFKKLAVLIIHNMFVCCCLHIAIK